MKKTILSILMLGALFTSCDMDLSPKGTLSDGTELSFDDMTKLRNGLYSGFRGACGGGYIVYPDIMMDQFNGTLDNGNRLGILANKLFNSSTGEFSTVYSACYSGIASINYAIGEFEKFAAANTIEGEDKLLFDLYMGEAKFFRAYRYWYLFDHYCQHYTADKGDLPALGLSMQMTYNPNGISSNYPGRSTMNETIAIIKSDLTDAYNALIAYEKVNSSNLAPEANYLSSDVVKAFEARMSLCLEDYDAAIAAAEPIVTSNRYALTPASAYEKIWSEDTGTELLMVPFASATEGGGTSIYGSYNSVASDNAADYLPSQQALLLYENGDVRFDAFFLSRQLNIQTTDYLTFVFYKWPGNAEMAGNGRINKTKPFRASELYLILAEAYAMKGENPEKGLGYLNDMLEARYEAGTFTDLALQGNALIDRIREERAKELIGEGFRLSDLKRWGVGFTRSIDYSVVDQVAGNVDPLKNAFNPIGVITYAPNDNFYTWPIPAAEMDINPQLEGQQNPGY